MKKTEISQEILERLGKWYCLPIQKIKVRRITSGAVLAVYLVEDGFVYYQEGTDHPAHQQNFAKQPYQKAKVFNSSYGEYFMFEGRRYYIDLDD